jgi:LytS/YehU family sensor histidine kinase
MIPYLLLSIATGLIGSYLSKEKGRSVTIGFLLGFFFNLIGLLVIAIVHSKIEYNNYLSKNITAKKRHS